jgi:hypothetical protein
LAFVRWKFPNWGALQICNDLSRIHQTVGLRLPHPPSLPAVILFFGELPSGTQPKGAAKAIQETQCLARKLLLHSPAWARGVVYTANKREPFQSFSRHGSCQLHAPRCAKMRENNGSISE